MHQNCLKIWLHQSIFLFFDLNLSKNWHFGQKFQNSAIFCNFWKEPPIFSFLTNFFGLSIQFSYSRSKNLKSLMPLFIKYPAGKWFVGTECVHLYMFKHIQMYTFSTYKPLAGWIFYEKWHERFEIFWPTIAKLDGESKKVG